MKRRGMIVGAAAAAILLVLLVILAAFPWGSLRGTIERVTSKVFLLSPEFVQVDGDSSADEGSFYNQS